MKLLRIIQIVALTITLMPTGIAGLSVSDQDYAVALARNVTLQVDFGNGTVNTYEDVLGTNVLEVTESVLPVGVDWFGNLAFVKSIGGVSESDDAGLWWQYWVNSELSVVAANAYQIQDNDTIVWRYTTSQVGNPNPTEPDNSLLLGTIVLGFLGIGFLIVLYLLNGRN
ncbi:MAG: DUF4430 domain-containing protein [Candidatus Thorarchaeota archaeon]